MRTLASLCSATLLASLAATTGCVVYDSDCRGGPDEFCGSDGFNDDRDDIDEGEEDPVVELQLSFAPNRAEQGEVFPAVIQIAEGEADLSTATALELYGDVVLVSWVPSPNSITAIIEVPGDAELGEVDVVVEFDNDGELLPGALTIFEAGSGNSGLGWTGDGAGDGGSAEDDCE